MPQPEGLPPGVYPYLTNEEYQADPAIGSSGIKNLLISPRRYWFQSPLNPKRKIKKKTAAMNFGTAYHAMRLEPKNFEAYVAIEPEKWPTAKEHPEKLSQEKQKELWREANKQKVIITRPQYEVMDEMFYAMQATPEHLNALRGGIPECSVFWRDEHTQLMCKIRVDNFAPSWVSDLKTITTIDDKNMRYEFPKRGYDVSGSMYSEGMMQLKKMIAGGYKLPEPFTPEFVAEFMAEKQQHFCFVFQEKEDPYITRLWRMSPWSVEVGHAKFTKGLYIYHDHQDRIDAWPSGFAAIEDITEDMVSSSINF